jgi:hypothetical protein
MDEDAITRIYYDVDDFCTVLEGYCKAQLTRKQNEPVGFRQAVSLSEVMSIILLFHFSNYRSFK